MSERRAQSPRYREGTWRWLFFDRFVTTRVAGTEPIDGIEPGGILGYTAMSLGWGLKFWKFPRAYSFWRRASTVKMRCGCGHHFWRRKPYVTSPSCELHGIRKMLNDLYREHPELRAGIADTETPPA